MNIEHPTSNTEHRMEACARRHSMFGVRCWMFDVSVLFVVASLLFTVLTHCFAAETNELKLWYSRPAEKWTDALPLGTGHMGAMVFGGIIDERIQFNEDTLWKGQPHDYVRTNAGDQLAE